MLFINIRRPTHESLSTLAHFFVLSNLSVQGSFINDVRYYWIYFTLFANGSAFWHQVLSSQNLWPLSLRMWRHLLLLLKKLLISNCFALTSYFTIFFSMSIFKQISHEVKFSLEIKKCIYVVTVQQQ